MRRPFHGYVRRVKLRIPAALVFTLAGCGGGGKTVADAGIDGDGTCKVACIPDGTDAGVCPMPYECVSATTPHVCPAGCECTAFCFPDTPAGEANCPTTGGLQCASPDRTCPSGCSPVG